MVFSQEAIGNQVRRFQLVTYCKISYSLNVIISIIVQCHLFEAFETYLTITHYCLHFSSSFTDPENSISLTKIQNYVPLEISDLRAILEIFSNEDVGYFYFLPVTVDYSILNTTYIWPPAAASSLDHPDVGRINRNTMKYTQQKIKTHHFIMIMLFDMSNYKCMM